MAGVPPQKAPLHFTLQHVAVPVGQNYNPWPGPNTVYMTSKEEVENEAKEDVGEDVDVITT